MIIHNGNGTGPGSTAPVVVLTASRSGSTLLRFILDTHPDLACPPETGMGGVCSHLTRFLGVLDGTAEDAPPGQGAITADTEAAIVQLLNDSYGRYLRQQGKRRLCDKSLDNVLNADLIATLWPDAQFLCLVRHCMDVIASGVEACSWGLSGFGFEAFAAQFPGNSVAAIGAYWAQSISAVLEFEKDHPDRCHRIRYEDLVSDPEPVTSNILRFLGERQVPGITQACFRTPHEASGPGDEKIRFTSQIGRESVGRGVAVPAAMFPPPLRDHINALLGELGYRPITEEWNLAARPVDPRAVLPPPSPDALTADRAGSAPGASSPLLATVAGLIAERTGPSLEARQTEIVHRWPQLADQTLGVIVTAAGKQEEFCWPLPGGQLAEDADGSIEAGTDNTAVPLAGDAQTWHAVLIGSANMAVELRAGRLRWTGAGTRSRLSTDKALALAELLGVSATPSAIDAGIPGHNPVGAA